MARKHKILKTTLVITLVAGILLLASVAVVTIVYCWDLED